MLRRIGEGGREYLEKWVDGEGRVDTCEIDECVMDGVLRGSNKIMLSEGTMIRVTFVTFNGFLGSF